MLQLYIQVITQSLWKFIFLIKIVQLHYTLPNVPRCEGKISILAQAKQILNELLKMLRSPFHSTRLEGIHL